MRNVIGLVLTGKIDRRGRVPKDPLAIQVRIQQHVQCTPGLVASSCVNKNTAFQAQGIASYRNPYFDTQPFYQTTRDHRRKDEEAQMGR